jgi:hypothetical protein
MNVLAEDATFAGVLHETVEARESSTESTRATIG